MTSRKHFIIACGRSGTHWLGGIIAAHPKFDGTYFDVRGTEPIAEARRSCDQVFYYPATFSEKFDRICRIWDQYHQSVTPKHYLDKSHGCIWIAQQMAKRYPDAKFIGIERTVLPTIASLLLRNSSMRQKRLGNAWKKYPLPCAPAGISKNLAHSYSGFIPEQRAALVWLAHQIKMKKLRHVLKDRLLVVQYEALQKNSVHQVTGLCTFLEIEPTENMLVQANTTLRALQANQKWKKELKTGATEKVHMLLADTNIVDEVRKAVDYYDFALRKFT